MFLSSTDKSWRRGSRLIFAIVFVLLTGAFYAYVTDQGEVTLRIVTDEERQAFERRWRERMDPLRDIFIKAGRNNGVEWPLLASIAYQESQWRENAVSHSGVRGLMMLTRVTAKEVGVTDREDPGDSAAGAARYLQLLVDTAPATLADENKIWFAVAAYNGGPARLKRVFRKWRSTVSEDGAWTDFEQYTIATFKQSSTTAAAIRYTQRVRDYHVLAKKLM